MKVGTDGVLLGAWCRIDPAQDEAILDIGTGTGLIALQLAQRTETGKALIDAVEIDERSCRRAEENFRRSPWSDRLRACHTSIQDFTERHAGRRQYGHIVSNPPWFVASLLPPNTSRSAARHSHSLSYDDLMRCCSGLLKPDGRLSLVLPAGAETEKMIAAADTAYFEVSRLTEVHSTPESGPKRTLLEFSRRTATIPEAVQTGSLVIQDAGPGTFSEEYRALTRDFYLHF